ncbi:MAG TPA: SAM-dependent chlorinase/fluorinase [Bryobacteraceae bacterium]|nr:SAM-dependent chlorinase/fluorinase [Bryobacteraceae bacterium]
MKRPIVTLLTDFGTSDHYVAAMKGVILGICPTADLVDITHDITPYAIAEGAYTLSQAWRCFPRGTIHLAVVDPGVGSKRRAILAEAEGHRFISPDNGLLSFVLRSASKATVREISENRFFRKSVSRTFHGRDIFAPVSAHLASGIAPKRFGDVISDTQIGDFSEVIEGESGTWFASVLKVDRFGNVISNLESGKFGRIAVDPFRLKIGRQTVSSFRHTYSEALPTEIFALFGSSGYIEVSLNQSDAASMLGVQAGSPITVSIQGKHRTRTRGAAFKE